MLLRPGSLMTRRPAPSPITLASLSASDGTEYTTDPTVVASDGTEYTLDSTVVASDGIEYEMT